MIAKGWRRARPRSSARPSTLALALALGVALAGHACGQGESASSSDTAASSSSGGAATTSTSSASLGAGGATATSASGPATSSSSGGGAGGGPPSSFSASLSSRKFLCKLISNAFPEDPTPNQTQTRANLKGTDLGVPVALGGALHLFFGDTQGYKVIWSPGEDPDSTAQLPLSSVAADPSALCSQLDFALTPDIPSVANAADPSILRDFAGAWMTPPFGQTIDLYIAQPAGPFPNMPGTFEVPTGGLAQNGKIYLFYAGLVTKTPTTRATLSYLARWDAPGTSLPSYQVLRPVDALASGPLGGHFLQVAPVPRAGKILLFGTGDYRHSGVTLARLDANALESGGGEELYDPSSATWHAVAALSPVERAAIPPIFETDGVGELSVQHLDAADLYVALYQRQLYDASGNIDDNRVLLRVARAPEGPWSDALTVVDMADPAFQSAHCCGVSCPGDQILHCDRAGLYGAYLLPTATAGAAKGGAFDLDLPFVVSTWDPYNVVLFTAAVHVAPAP